MNTKTLYPILVGIVIFISSNTATLASTTYYVDTNNSQASDSNSGSQSLPWKTIQKASSVMVAGDTAIIMPGTYNEKVTTTRSGSSGNKIIFKASAGTVTVNGFAIGHNYITVDGFVIPTNKNITATGSFCEILNNHLYDSYIYISSSTASNCIIKGNHIEGTTSRSSDWTAIYIDGSNHIVENNEIGPIKDTDAFRPFGHDNIIRKNYIHDITLSPGSGAHMDIFQVFGTNGNEISYNIAFENNLIINSTGQMFMTEVGTDGTGGNRLHDWDVRNNTWVNIALQGNVGIPNFRFYNNTLYNADYVNGFALYLYPQVWGDPTGAKIVNNIFIDAGGVDNTSVTGAYYIAKGTNITTDYNYVARGPSHGYAALTGFTESHGINGGDPKFVNLSTNDFHLQQNSPAINKGTALTGFNYDADNISRPQGAAWDIGAFEYTGGSTTLAPPTNLRAQ